MTYRGLLETAEMADFTSGFWSWFIGITSLVSVVGCFVFAWMQAHGKRGGSPPDKVETMGHVWDEDLAEYNNPMPRWWLNLFYITVVWGLIYLFLYPGLGAYEGYLGWSQTAQYEQEVAAADATFGPIFEQYADQKVEEIEKDPAAMKIGERLFATYCSTCHGADARGALPA